MGLESLTLVLFYLYDASISYIVDDTKKLHGKKLGSLEIKPRESLIEEDKSDIFILVNARTTSAVNAIFSNLKRWALITWFIFSIAVFYILSIGISEKLKENLNLTTDYSKFKIV